MTTARVAVPRVALLSLEPWDDVWRRNQHLASRLVANGTIGSLVFVEPPASGLAVRARRRSPLPNIEVLTPPLVVPRRFGGHRVLGAWLRRALAGVDLLWINDPVAGSGALRRGQPALYDVTDDWRSMPQNAADRARIVAAEDRLANLVPTVVCSEVLARHWMKRYGVSAELVGNGVDAEAIQTATPHDLPGPGPHLLYAGTLHTNRLDLDLICELTSVGTVHLVGPNYLDDVDGDRMVSAGVRIHGPVRAPEVASWLVSADVLICPHRVDDFTLSLDAIKSYEYLATDRPVVATPSSGFQSLVFPGLQIVPRTEFKAAVQRNPTIGIKIELGSRQIPTWDDRANKFGGVVEHYLRRRRPSDTHADEGSR